VLNGDISLMPIFLYLLWKKYTVREIILPHVLLSSMLLVSILLFQIVGSSIVCILLIFLDSLVCIELCFCCCILFLEDSDNAHSPSYTFSLVF